MGEEPAVNILVLGTDSHISTSDPSQWKEGAQHTDAIMIIQVSEDRKMILITPIPRDSWVEIPDYGQGRINTVYSYRGPLPAIHAAESLTDIRTNHFVVANFGSFVALTDEIGGVQVSPKTPQRFAGRELGAGAQVLDGQQALAYTRERPSLPSGDFDRAKRQQIWMRSTVSRVLTNDTLSSPTALYSPLKTIS